MRVGILATGHIAEKMADTINRTEGVELYAVGSRSAEKAAAFAARYSAEVSYGSYRELMEDEKVDLLYIATPHSSHAELMKQAIGCGRNILCEKAFTINRAEAEDVFALAKEKGTLVAEAIWTRYMPSLGIIRSMASKIGKVSSISANLGYMITHKERIMSPALGGGALLDIGIYPLNFALMVHPVALDSMAGLAEKAETGVDIVDSITLKFEDGVIASLYADATATTDRRGYINGSEGCVEIVNINCPEEIIRYDSSRNREEVERVKIAFETGYEFELLACRKAIEEGLSECPEMPWSETLRVLSVMDALRSVWGVKLANEK
jgi:Predicted dehydrogenases and related proteins